MVIKPFINGPFSVNTFLLIDGNDAILIDPGAGIRPLLEEIKSLNLHFLAFFVTHPHVDHVDGVPFIRELFPDTPGYISNTGIGELQHIPLQARMFGVKNPGLISFENGLPSEGTLETGPFSIRFFSTPGHCPGSLSFIVNDNLFPGDALFSGTIGRTDLPGGDMTLLLDSIERKIFTLPEAMPVYPGHGTGTTVGYEKKHNPFFNHKSA